MNLAATGNDDGAIASFNRLAAPQKFRSIVLAQIGNCYLRKREFIDARRAYLLAWESEKDALSGGAKKEGDTSKYILGYCEYFIIYINAIEGDVKSKDELKSKFCHIAELRPAPILTRYYLELPKPPNI